MPDPRDWSREASRALTIGTLHAFCVRLLRQHAERLGYKNNFAIYSQDEQVGLVKRILGRLVTKDESYDASAGISRISKAKNHGISLGDQGGCPHGQLAPVDQRTGSINLKYAHTAFRHCR